MKTLPSVLVAGVVLVSGEALAHADYCGDLQSDMDTVWDMIGDAECLPWLDEPSNPMMRDSLFESIDGMIEDFENSSYPTNLD